MKYKQVKTSQILSNIFSSEYIAQNLYILITISSWYDSVPLTFMTSAGKFVYIAHHFILLRISPFGFRVDREGWWFEHSLSWLRVCLSAEGAKNVSGPWLSPLRGWSSLTMTFTGKLVYMTHYFILLRFNPFDRVNKEGWWFEHSVS